MKEQEYIDVSDRVKVTNALNILRDILPSISSVINGNEYAIVLQKLIEWEEELFKIIEVKE